VIANLVSLAGALGLVIWLVAAVFWALAGAALASWLGRPWWHGALLGAVLLPVGPVVLLVAAGLARSRRTAMGAPHPVRPAATWHSHLPRWTVAAAALALAVVLVWVTGRPDTRLGLGEGRQMDLAIRDVGLTSVTLVSGIVLVAAAAVSAWRPTRWAAVAVAWCGAWWLLWSLAALLVGDTLRVLVASTHATSAVPLVVRVGLSWSLLLGVSALLLTWSVAVLAAAARRQPAAQRIAAAPGRAVGSLPASGATSTTALPPAAPAHPVIEDPFADGWRSTGSGTAVPGWAGTPTTQHPAHPLADPFSEGR
jgi:hypothetical protein